MNMTGKEIKGIKITKHTLPKSVEQKVNKSKVKEYQDVSASSQALQRHRGIGGIDAALENINEYIRTHRRVLMNKSAEKQHFEFEFKIPLNVALDIYRGDSRKIEDYSTVYREGIEVDLDSSISSIYKKFKEKKDRLIKNSRNKQKTPRTPQGRFSVNLGAPHKFQYALQAGCHVTPGEILSFKRAKGKPPITTAKAPTTHDNYVGIEIEFVCKLNAQSLGLKLMVSDLSQWCNLKTDGSVRDESGTGYFPHELALCIPENKMEEVIDGVCKVLNEAGARVNKTCGFHVHLDMRQRNRDVCFSNLVSSQSIMYAMQPAPRRDSRFCKKTVSKTFTTAVREPGGDGNTRYVGINPHSFEKYNTIEIRIHTGTTNANKIKNWVNLLVGIANSTKVITEEPTKADKFGKLFDLKPEVVEYIKSRMLKFKSKTEGIENEENGVAA